MQYVHTVNDQPRTILVWWVAYFLEKGTCNARFNVANVQLCRYECIREIDIGNTCYLEMFPYLNILSIYHSMCIHRMLLFASTNHQLRQLLLGPPANSPGMDTCNFASWYCVKHTKTFKILSNRLIPSILNHVRSYCPITLCDTIVSYFRNKMISHEHDIYISIYIYM